MKQEPTNVEHGKHLLDLDIPAAFGDVVRDSVTKFEGVFAARSEYMNGCIHIGIKSTTLKDGKPMDLEWFDIGLVQMVDAVKSRSAKPAEPPKVKGGPALR